jgi:LmbE family N-acetylglucosaminyl deacetylase
METLGITQFSCLEYDDQLLDREPFTELLSAIAAEIDDWAGIVYTHWCHDLNRDHRILNEVVQVLTRPRQGPPLEIREFPTLSSTEYSREVFVPNLWVEITETLEIKVAAMECYVSELQPEHLSRNARAIREYAATLGRQVGVQAAEVFDVVKRVI